MPTLTMPSPTVPPQEDDPRAAGSPVGSPVSSAAGLGAPVGRPMAFPDAGSRANDVDEPTHKSVLTARNLSISYGDHVVVRDVDLDIAEHRVTAIIGPSGCGKSTVLRCFNRMNDLVGGCRVEGSVEFHGVDLYTPDVEPVEVRRRIGMVFQRPTVFPKSIYANVAYGLKINRIRDSIDDRVEQALRQAALWDEVSDRLGSSALGLSGGQQQRLCIARALAVEPEVLLMDEPCSALDPIATARIEDLLAELADRVTIVIVTHNLAQAARAGHTTAFLTAEVDDDGSRCGVLVEVDATERIFGNPADERTEQYVTGRFG